MATPEGTEKYSKKFTGLLHIKDGYRNLGKTGFTVSAIGFGGYRVHNDSDEHKKALVNALLNGINLFDTSSNYTDGGSEMLAGNTLLELEKQKKISRDEVVLVSKAGYVQGSNLKAAAKRESEGNPYPDMVKYMDGCWHCIHPDFLEDQLRLTLGRLGFDSLDVYLLHNPEYFLTDKKKSVKSNNIDINTIREEYYRRISIAFEWMEQKVKEGLIGSYGISSNTFPKASDDFEFTSLERVLKSAENVASDNHFQVIQFPFNPFENGACNIKNQDKNTKTLLEKAEENSLATLINRPLNSMTEKGMIRLVHFKNSNQKQVIKDFDKKLERLSALESGFSSKLIDRMPPEISRETLLKVFSLTKELKEALVYYKSWEHWDHVKNNVIIPQTISYLEYIHSKMSTDTEWFKWMQNYNTALNDFLDTVTKYFENHANKRSKNINKKLDSQVETLKKSKTLSQKALRLITSVSGVSCVLLGMRKVEYVEDALKALKESKIPNALPVMCTLSL